MPEPISQCSMLDARVRSGEAAWRHIEAEIADVVDEIMATFVPDEPYACTVQPTSVEPAPPSAISRQEFVSSRRDVRASYENMYGFAAAGPLQPVAEIRGDWYVFIYGLAEGRIKATNQTVHAPTAVLFPTMGKNGIAGELLRNRVQALPVYTGRYNGPLAAETAILERHAALFDGLHGADAQAVARLFHPDAQIGIRNYVNDTRGLVEMHSGEELKHYFEQFFARFDLHEISLVNRLATDWFVFDELLWIVEDKENPGRKLAFHTAEHSEVMPDGLFASRIGYGTDLKAL